MNTKNIRHIQRKQRVRSKITGTGKRPRLSVFKSNKFIYSQIIDDEKGVTIVAAKGAKNSAEKVGEELAKRAVAKKVKKVVFDRNGFVYHGRIKTLADAARKGGLEF